MENVNDCLLVLLIAAASLVSTIAIWFRFRGLALLRPWLVRHVIGNVVLALGLLLACFLNLTFFYYVPIIACIFAMWVWGTWKLRAAMQDDKQRVV